MKKITYLLAFVAVFLLPSQTQAGIEWISGEVMTSDFRKTMIPFLDGKTTTYVLKGPWVDYVTKVENLGSGMSLTKLQTGTESTGTQPWERTGTLTLALTMSGATAGKRTLELRNALNQLIDSLEIYVVRIGSFSAPQIWPVQNYFNQATVIVTGQKLGSAALDVAGWPQGTTASFVSPMPPPMDNMAQITLRFPTYLAEASGDIMLYDKGMPSLCKNLLGTYAYKAAGTTSVWKRVTIQGQNAVKSISFPGGPAFGSGQTVTIRLNFYRPIGQQGAVIYWRLSPKEGNAVAQAISPTSYDPNAQFNQRTANPGATYIDLTIRVCGCLGGVWTVPVGTWFGSTDTASGPGFKTSSFTVSCPAGGVSCP